MCFVHLTARKTKGQLKLVPCGSVQHLNDSSKIPKSAAVEHPGGTGIYAAPTQSNANQHTAQEPSPSSCFHLVLPEEGGHDWFASLPVLSRRKLVTEGSL